MTAVSGETTDCTWCQSAGSVRHGRCEICETDQSPPRRMRATVQLTAAEDSTLTSVGSQ